MSGIDLVEAARIAATYGDGNISLGTDQNFILTGIPGDRIDDLLSEPLLQKYSPDPGPFVRGVVSCTGSEFCRFAVVETKERAVKWARWLDAKLGDDAPTNDTDLIRMHISGCSASVGGYRSISFTTKSPSVPVVLAKISARGAPSMRTDSVSTGVS